VRCQFVVTIQEKKTVENIQSKGWDILKPRNYSILKSKVEAMLNIPDFVFRVNIYYEFVPSKKPTKYLNILPFNAGNLKISHFSNANKSLAEEVGFASRLCSFLDGTFDRVIFVKETRVGDVKYTALA